MTMKHKLPNALRLALALAQLRPRCVSPPLRLQEAQGWVLPARLPPRDPRPQRKPQHRLRAPAPHRPDQADKKR